jgi:HTH-type transcriptional regulator/antitoxin HigA
MTRKSGKMTLTIDENVYSSLLVEFQPKVITTEEENERTLVVVEKLMNHKDRTPEQDAILDLLVVLIEKFESEHYQLNAATPQSILLYLMEERNMTQSELADLIGSKGVASEILSGKRGISKRLAKKLGEFFHVSPELFI